MSVLLISWSAEEGRVSPRYPAAFAVYQWLHREGQEERRPAPDTPAPAPRQGRPQPPRPRRLTYKERQELVGLEGHIEELEGGKKDLQEEINRSGSDYVRLQSLASELEALEAELERSMERWLELPEIAVDG